MRRVLCCWELGGGLGHAFRLDAIAQALDTAQQDVTVYLPQQATDAQERRWPGRRSYAAPGWPVIELRRFSLSYPENLFKNGYHKPAVLARNLKAWLQIYEREQPDVLIAEHAPTALLAARHAGLNRLAVGTGFTLPPLEKPMPSMQPWFPISKKILEGTEDRLVNSINQALNTIGSKPLDSAAEIFAGVRRLLCTVAETDHYEGRAGESYAGPVYSFADAADLTWNCDDRRGVFVYLNPHNRFLGEVLETLHGASIPTIAFIPHLNGDDLSRMAKPGIEIYTHPVDLSRVFPHCRLAITQGGHNTGIAFLLHGIPLLVLPEQLEQTVWGYRLSERGLGAMVNPFNRDAPVGSKIIAAYESGKLQQAAGDLQSKYSKTTGREPIQAILNLVGSFQEA